MNAVHSTHYLLALFDTLQNNLNYCGSFSCARRAMNYSNVRSA